MEAPPRRLLITPLQWIVGGMLLAIFGGLAFVLLRAPPRPESLANWYPPGGTVMTSAGGAVVLSAPQSLTNVAGWYSQRLGAFPGGPGPSFQYRSSSAFPFSKRWHRLGVYLPSFTNQVRGGTYIVKRANGVLLIHLSQAPGESNTCVQIFRHIADGVQSPPVEPLLTLLSYPFTAGNSMSSGGDILFRTLTIQADVATVAAWYTNQLGLARTRPGAAVIANAATAFLPSVPGGRTNCLEFFYASPRAAALIEAHRKASNTTEVIINMVTF